MDSSPGPFPFQRVHKGIFTWNYSFVDPELASFLLSLLADSVVLDVVLLGSSEDEPSVLRFPGIAVEDLERLSVT